MRQSKIYGEGEGKSEGRGEGYTEGAVRVRVKVRVWEVDGVGAGAAVGALR